MFWWDFKEVEGKFRRVFYKGSLGKDFYVVDRKRWFQLRVNLIKILIGGKVFRSVEPIWLYFL